MDADGLDLCFDDSPLVADAVMARHRVAPPALVVPPLPPVAAEIARRTWEDRTRAEYIGVMVARRFHGLLVDLNAPNDVQELAVAILMHEQRHVSLCLAAARALGSGGELAFELDELQQPRTAAGPAADAFEMVAATFALGEVTALGLVRSAIRAAPESGFREILRRIARDEVLHARIGPALLRACRAGQTSAWLPWPGNAEVRTRVAAHRAALAVRAVVEPEDAAAAREPRIAEALASVAIPAGDAFKSAYLQALDRDVAATWRRFGLADLLESPPVA